jgi:hypothetical protein
MRGDEDEDKVPRSSQYHALKKYHVLNFFCDMETYR